MLCSISMVEIGQQSVLMQPQEYFLRSQQTLFQQQTHFLIRYMYMSRFTIFIRKRFSAYCDSIEKTRMTTNE